MSAFCPNNRRYELAGQVTAQIVNLIDPSTPKSETFGKIVFVILDLIDLTELEQREALLRPSEN